MFRYLQSRYSGLAPQYCDVIQILLLFKSNLTEFDFSHWFHLVATVISRSFSRPDSYNQN